MDKLKEKINKGITESYLNSDIEDVRESLSNYGVDLDKNAKRQNKLIKQLKFKLRSSLNEEKYDLLLNKATESFQDAIDKGLEKPVAYLNSLIRENRVRVQYNKLEKLSTDEIKEIIKDQNLIEIIELLENEQSRKK
ncbi:hypothetical protein [Salegentibacter maritimus]|uniref:Uncharacterized protein n=1 Tax=Salegentibacter maritimus TaxID=2794347 RepID=A0ABS0TCT9_9FLAO|nr:hypothetical protein [Salegentibacter maritimus]MBI6118866.1 hypothetical protein [Salegentibacter maritimus]